MLALFGVLLGVLHISVRLLALLPLLLNGMVFVLGFFVVVKPLEKAIEIQVVEVGRGDRHFCNDDFDVLLLQL